MPKQEKATKMAEGVGFEPTDTHKVSSVFKTDAISQALPALQENGDVY